MADAYRDTGCVLIKIDPKPAYVVDGINTGSASVELVLGFEDGSEYKLPGSFSCDTAMAFAHQLNQTAYAAAFMAAVRLYVISKPMTVKNPITQTFVPAEDAHQESAIRHMLNEVLNYLPITSSWAGEDGEDDPKWEG
jgi:hypothetical protein